MGRAKVRQYIKWAVIVLVAAYIVYQFRLIRWGELAENWHKFQPLFLGFAFLAFLAGLFYLGLGWHLILWRMGGRLPFRRGFYIWLASQLGRFVPGKVVLVLGRAYMCEKEGIKKRVTSASVIYEMAFMTLAAFILFFVSIGLGPPPDPPATMAPLLEIIQDLWFLVFLGVVVIHPRLFYALINFLLKRIGKEPMSRDFRFRDSLMILLYYVGFWAILGFGFFFVIRSVDPTARFANLLPIAGIYAGACSAGFLAIFVPDGWGVREGFMKNLLLGTGIVAEQNYPFLIGIMVRLVSLAPEILAFFVVRALTDTSRYTKPSPANVAEEAGASP